MLSLQVIPLSFQRKPLFNQ